jgi:hypothetical protein
MIAKRLNYCCNFVRDPKIVLVAQKDNALGCATNGVLEGMRHTLIVFMLYKPDSIILKSTHTVSRAIGRTIIHNYDLVIVGTRMDCN